MASEVETEASAESDPYTWLTGIFAGLVGAVVTGLVIQFGFNPTILSEGIPSGFGVSGMAAGWAVFLVIGAVLGLIYTAATRIDRIRAYAVLPRTGTYLGLLYGLVLWVLAVIVVPLWVGAGSGKIGGYAVNLQGVLSFALLGILIGLIYGASPYTD